MTNCEWVSIEEQLKLTVISSKLWKNSLFYINSTMIQQGKIMIPFLFQQMKMGKSNNPYLI